MTGLPFDEPGRFWRGNLHTHSNRSDGALSPSETARVYREGGYDFVAIIDHFRGRRPRPRPALSWPWRARIAGAFVGMAHPSASLLTAVDADSLDAAHAVEVYNALADRENRGDRWHLTDVLLNRGRRLTTYAADDAHLQPQDPPPCQAWVQVRAESLDPANLLTALKAGQYYSSTGPELYDVHLENDVVVVRCSPATKILLSGGTPARRLPRAPT